MKFILIFLMICIKSNKINIKIERPDYTNDKEEGISVIEKAENAVL